MSAWKCDLKLNWTDYYYIVTECFASVKETLTVSAQNKSESKRGQITGAKIRWQTLGLVGPVYLTKLSSFFWNAMLMQVINTTTTMVVDFHSWKVCNLLTTSTVQS